MNEFDQEIIKTIQTDEQTVPYESDTNEQYEESKVQSNEVRQEVEEIKEVVLEEHKDPHTRNLSLMHQIPQTQALQIHTEFEVDQAAHQSQLSSIRQIPAQGDSMAAISHHKRKLFGLADSKQARSSIDQSEFSFQKNSENGGYRFKNRDHKQLRDSTIKEEKESEFANTKGRLLFNSEDIMTATPNSNNIVKRQKTSGQITETTVN